MSAKCSGLVGPASLVAAVLLLVAPASMRAQEKPQAELAVKGGTTFRHYCRSCHGDAAHGDGPVAQYLTPKPANLTKIAERNHGQFPAEEVYAAIAGGQPVKGHGTSEMPVWGTAFREVRGTQTDEEVKARITELVAYLRSIQDPPPTTP